MDDLMMNLFSRIAGQVKNRQELFDHEGKIMQTLLNEGYHLHEANAALMLMQALVKKQSETFFGEDASQQGPGQRTMNSEERRRFATDAFAFALKLTHLGVLSEDQREELLERAMTLYRERIGLEHIKGLVAFMLFSSGQDRQDSALSNHRNIRNTDWN